jgi:hypothetical protein
MTINQKKIFNKNIIKMETSSDFFFKDYEI